MRFKIGRDTLSEAVQWSARAVPQRPAVAVLSGVRITATDQMVEFSSFDYEISARAQTEAEVEEAGEVLVSGKLLAEISKSLPNRDVFLEVADNHLQIRCGNSEFSLSLMNMDEYPNLPPLPQVQGTIDANEFAGALQQVAVAASKEEALPLLTGVKMVIEGDQITLLATDRYRLSMRKLSWQPVGDPPVSDLLVKAKVLTDFAKSLTSAGDIELSLSEGSAGARSSLIGFAAGGRQATSVLMDGDYPPVAKLFPEETPLTYVCNRQELLEAVRRVSLVAERKTSVRLTFADGVLTLEAGQGADATAQEAVAAITDSEDLQTAFNPQYLQEGLSVTETEYVQFGFTHPTKAAVMVGLAAPNDPVDEKFKYLLMPIRFGV